jgi:hypothetical protein
MMREGRLVWHRDTMTGAWFTVSHFDESNHLYVATRADGGGFDVELRRSGVEPVVLGWHRKLDAAKHAADADHQDRILRELPDGDVLKTYVQRFRI